MCFNRITVAAYCRQREGDVKGQAEKRARRLVQYSSNAVENNAASTLGGQTLAIP